MAIANLGELRTEIATWVNRNDLTTANLSMFVTLTEADIRNDLRTREDEVLATGTMSGDGFNVPTGFMSVRTLTVDGHLYEYLDPETYATYVDREVTNGYYTINGTAVSVLGGDGYDYELLYTAQNTALSSSSDSNWVLENAPTVYLWGGCRYACAFLKDTEGEVAYKAKYELAVSQLNTAENKARLGGPLMRRAVTVE